MGNGQGGESIYGKSRVQVFSSKHRGHRIAVGHVPAADCHVTSVFESLLGQKGYIVVVPVALCSTAGGLMYLLHCNGPYSLCSCSL